MPTLQELEALLAEPAAPQGRGRTLPDIGLVGAAGNVATGVFEAGKGGLFHLLDFLDRGGAEQVGLIPNAC